MNGRCGTLCSGIILLLAPGIFFGTPFTGSAQVRDSNSVLIFVSDTQSPLTFERLYPNYSENERATQIILGDILDEKNVEAVVHAGDITGYGSSKKEWAPLVAFLDSLRARKIPFLAAKGNHDYYFMAHAAMKNFAEYVPDSPTDFSLHKFAPVAIVLLNSNFSHMSQKELYREKKWYPLALDSCESDTSIHFIITVDHHPPFTNSAVVSGSKKVRKYFLPYFYRSDKSVLFVSGHAHRFEHFKKDGKDFIVIGGGGGVFQNEKKNPSEKDLYTSADHGEFFHYVRCTVDEDSLTFNVMQVGPERGRLKWKYAFVIRKNPDLRRGSR